MKRFFLKLLTIVCLTACFTIPSVASEGFDNSNALKNISKAQVYFDVSVKESKLLLLRMELLDRTIKELEKDGLEVSGVVGFRGPASRYITKDEHYVLEESVADKKKIQEWVKTFAANGIIVEQCAIAAEILNIPADDFIPEIKIVGNGYVSLIGYQAQGYSVVPMD